MSYGFDPYTYQPQMRYLYDGGPLPQQLSAVAEQNPEAANHIRSVWQLSNWMQTYFPDMYSAITAQRPDLLDAGAVVLSGQLAVNKSSGGKLAGLGETAVTVGAPDDPITVWGKQILGFANNYLQFDAQRDLLKANVSLVERGLPPINAGQIAPQVNFGLSPDMQKIALFGVAGLVVAGLVGAFRSGRK